MDTLQGKETIIMNPVAPSMFARDQTEAALSNVQEQASNALDQVSDAANGDRNQRTGTGTAGAGSLVPIQAGDSKEKILA